MEKALEIIELNKVYRNKVQALNDINLSVENWNVKNLGSLTIRTMGEYHSPPSMH